VLGPWRVLSAGTSSHAGDFNPNGPNSDCQEMAGGGVLGMDVSECASWFKVTSQVSGGYHPCIRLTASDRLRAIANWMLNNLK